MKMNARILFCAVCAFIPACVLLSSLLRPAPLDYVQLPGGERPFATLAEDFINRGFPFRDQFAGLGREIGLSGGQHENISMEYGYPAKRNGIFVTNDYLLKNIDAPIEHYVNENIEAVLEFSDEMRRARKQTYLMLVPTSGAILQQKLPRYADSVMENQKRFIEDAYSRVSSSADAIDAYRALIERSDQYIYYRTENNLTSLGGYYVYAAMLSRMGLGKADYDQFDIDYADDGFRGDLYAESGYANVGADTISLFRYGGANRTAHEFTVTQRVNGERKVYHTLFPQSAAELGHRLDIFLGGRGAVTDIRCSSQYGTKILIFGDKTAISYLPFLANNCERVTLVDLFYGSEEFEDIDPADYDKIIFAYGVESFMHTNNPARARALLYR